MEESLGNDKVANMSISKSLFAVQNRQLLDVVDKIRDLGSQLKIDVPRIVVIGNQSAGKSSLIEAIANINLPRGVGTCTRCPSEVRLRSSPSEWECSISLRFEYDNEGVRTPDSKTVIFGKPFSDRSKVEVMLRRAQLAILNPHRSANVFLELDPDGIEISAGQLTFSKNVICIDVAGPELTDLTFVDLPGIISSVSDGSQVETIDLIKSMVREYIQGSSLILVAITMKDDIDNQAAILEARQADREGIRTIGVLTKPDTLQAGEERQWMPIIGNEGPSRLKLGYFVTKQPSLHDVEKGITFAHARQQETNFFQLAPWSHFRGDVQKRFGTVNLTATLSACLLAFIRKLLPDIIENINDSHRAVIKDLANMPLKPSQNPVRDLIGICQMFTSALDEYVRGSDGSESLVQKNNSIFKQFKSSVMETTLRFHPFTSAENIMTQPEPEFLSEDLESPVSGTRASHRLNTKIHNLNDVRTRIQTSITRELPMNVPFSAKVRMILIPISRWDSLVEECFGEIFPNVSNLVSKLVDKHFGRFEHGGLHPTIIEIVEDRLRDRAAETKKMLKLVLDGERQPYTQNTHYFLSLREKLMAHYRHLRYENRISAIGSEIPSAPPSSRSPSPVDAYRISMPYGLPPQSRRPSVYTEGPVEDEGRFDSHHRKARNISVPRASQSSRENTVADIIRKLSILGWRGIREADLARLFKDDPYEEEITAMAETRAYFQVAYKRIIDVVPQMIDLVFVRSLAGVLNDALLAGLQIDAKDNYERCHAFLAESPHIVAQREELAAMLARLEKAKEALRAIGH